MSGKHTKAAQEINKNKAMTYICTAAGGIGKNPPIDNPPPPLPTVMYRRRRGVFDVVKKPDVAEKLIAIKGVPVAADRRIRWKPSGVKGDALNKNVKNVLKSVGFSDKK